MALQHRGTERSTLSSKRTPRMWKMPRACASRRVSSIAFSTASHGRVFNGASGGELAAS